MMRVMLRLLPLHGKDNAVDSALLNHFGSPLKDQQGGNAREWLDQGDDENSDPLPPPYFPDWLVCQEAFMMRSH